MTDELQNEATIEKPVAEEVADTATDKLSNRDALAKAIEERRESRTAGDQPSERSTQAAAPTNTEIKAAVKAGVDAPSEFSKEEKEAWDRGDIAGIQKAYRRVHDGRTVELTRAQRAEREAREAAKAAQNEGKTWRTLGDRLSPYIERRGKEGVAPDVAMMQLADLLEALKKESPETTRAELKRLGINLDGSSTTGSSALEEKISGLQAKVDSVLLEKEQRETEKVVSEFTTSINTLAALKTRTGESVFPGFQDVSEAGRQFAAELGSLTREPWFIHGVRRRIPQASHIDFVREAYLHLGGKVSGEPVSVSHDNKQQAEKSRRAAASTPGRSAARNDSSNLAGKLSTRAALARAIAESREH